MRRMEVHVLKANQLRLNTTNVNPNAIAAQQPNPSQLALGLLDGEVYVIEPLEQDQEWGSDPLSETVIMNQKVYRRTPAAKKPTLDAARNGNTSKRVFQGDKKEEYDEKLKEVKAICNPIITHVYHETGGAQGITLTRQKTMLNKNNFRSLSYIDKK
ncbi:topless-related protein 4-like protein [Tanacetum coccineum]